MESLPKITVILNVYKRINYIDEQINSVINQSLKPIEIIIWNNSEKDINIDLNKYSIPIIIFSSSKNLGVWARFFAGFNAKGTHIAVFDDDTIPGKKWFENCTTCMSIKDGLYGTTGYRFHQSYFQNDRIGWLNGNDTIEEVDIIGHAWFFKKDWLKYYVIDLPDLEKYKLMGEDIHLSYTFKKYGSIKSYIAIHPLNDKELYGSIKGLSYGNDNNALSHDNGANDRFELAYNYWVKKLGHKLVYYS